MIEKIGETSSLMTPVKEVTFKVETFGAKRKLKKALTGQKGILLANDCLEGMKVIFDSSKFKEEKFYQLIGE